MKTPDIRPLTSAVALLAILWAGMLPGQQTIPASEPPAPPAAENRSDEQSRFREAMDQRLREVLRTTLPAGSVPRSLTAALSGAASSGNRAEIVTAYWKAVRAAGEVAAAQEAVDRLQSLQPAAADAPLFQSLLAHAEAALQQAKATLKTAQYRLAGTMGAPGEQGLPFPSDIPHTGGYRTYLDRLMPVQAAAWELRMLDRTLPLRRQAMILHHAAARAAEDAWSAYRDAYLGGSAVGPSLFRVWKLLWEEEVAFFAAAEDYNLAVLGFASRVAPADLTAAQYVGMLIETASTSSSENSKPDSAGETSGPAASPGVPAGNMGGWTPAESSGSGTATPLGPPSPQGPFGAEPSPTPAPPEPTGPVPLPPPGNPTNAVPGISAPATESPGLPPVPFSPPAAVNLQAPDERSATAAEWLPMPALGAEATSAPTPVEASQAEFADLSVNRAAPATYLSETEDGALPPLVPLAPHSGNGAVRRVQRYAAPDAESPNLQDAANEPSLLVDALPTLASMSAIEQNRRLATLMFGRKILPPQSEATNLADLLRGCPPAQRREMLSAYWETAERKAEYIAWMQQTIVLAELFPPALQQWSRPGGAPAMLDLQAARTAADAGLENAHRRLIEAAYRLGALSGRNADVLPIPAGVPYVGPYAARAEALPASLRARSDIQAYLARLGGDFEALSYWIRSAAAWDEARRGAERRFVQGMGPLSDVLELADAEFRELLRYAAAAGAYNKCIAEYVLTAYPDLAPDVLMAALGATDA